MAGLVAGGALVFDARRLADEGRDAPQRRAAELNDGIRSRNIGAAVAFSIAGAALATGLATWLFTDRKETSAPGAPAPEVTVGWGRLGLAGRF